MDHGFHSNLSNNYRIADSTRRWRQARISMHAVFHQSLTTWPIRPSGYGSKLSTPIIGCFILVKSRVLQQLFDTHPHLGWWFHDPRAWLLRPFREALDSNPVIADDWKVHLNPLARLQLGNVNYNDLTRRQNNCGAHATTLTWNILSCGIGLSLARLASHRFLNDLHWFTENST